MTGECVRAGGSQTARKAPGVTFLPGCFGPAEPRAQATLTSRSVGLGELGAENGVTCGGDFVASANANSVNLLPRREAELTGLLHSLNRLSTLRPSPQLSASPGALWQTLPASTVSQVSASAIFRQDRGGKHGRMLFLTMKVLWSCITMS